ncbi:MAG: extracellular solute-binding protein, partial [Eubacteriales bacterium]|nr:extracellular solute-binding protein [Eubacteriales bacterium]MDD3880989.1 extracellular solute-binding protein [Eubacteriales bacterium]
FSNLTEPEYTAVLKGYTLPVYGGEDCSFPAEIKLETGSEAEINISAPVGGLYEIWLTYRNLTDMSLPTELTVRADGAISFFEMRRIKLRSEWIDDGIFPLDRYGNEVAMTPYPSGKMLTAPMEDSAGRTSEPFLFELAAGEHTLSFLSNDGDCEISEIILRAPTSVPEYEKHTAEGDKLIVIEAERMTSRDSSDIRGAGEFNALLSPYDVNSRKINFLDGASFDEAGDSVTYNITVPEDGYYQLGLYYRQGVKSDFPVFLDVMLDGAFRSAAQQKLQLYYSPDYSLYTATDAQGEPQSVYLSAGEHKLTLRINCEILTPVYEGIDRMLSEINGLSLEVVRLTGGITTDTYRDYNITGYIPELQSVLLSWADKCDELLSLMRPYSKSGMIGAFANLTICASQLRALAEKPEELPTRLNELSSGTSSVARMLATQLQEMETNDLSIDQIYLYQKDAALPEKVGFMEGLALGAQRFAASFSAQDYSVSSGDKGHLQVWMARSRQYVEIIQNMIDAEFTPKTGIEVDISIMPDAQKLVLANAAGNAPDVVLSVQYVIPSYLDIRGALYDLTKFEDFGEVAQRFSSGLFIPYILEDGVYALPETINFWVLFYRKDIFDALSIPVPDSMEEALLILPELQRRNMNFYFPTAGMVGTKVFPGTLPLILQSGGSIYDKTVGNTTLDSETSLAGFRALTELFTIYDMPVDVPAPGFYQQFRDGTLPIGIADLATYNLLLNAAPELDGLWDIALFPGLTNESGEVERWTTGGAETCGIFSTTDKPDESWEFLKWWTSAETQAEFGNTLQSTYGNEYIWPTANTEAFAQLPLQASHKRVIIEQSKWMTEAPWVLGTYMLERELSNAYISVVVEGMDARRAIDTAVKRINRETFRKLEEFGYYKDGKMLKDFMTPTDELIKRITEKYNVENGEAKDK